MGRWSRGFQSPMVNILGAVKISGFLETFVLIVAKLTKQRGRENHRKHLLVAQESETPYKKQI